MVFLNKYHVNFIFFFFSKKIKQKIVFLKHAFIQNVSFNFQLSILFSALYLLRFLHSHITVLKLE